MPSSLLSLLLLVATVAPANTIYKYVDKDGHTTFTNIPLRGAQAIVISPNTPTPAPRRSAAASNAAAANVAVPSVDHGTQRQRDEGRRRILQTELGNEQQALQQARTTLTDAQKKNLPPEQLNKLRAEVTDRERNIDALQRELGSQSALK